MTFWTWAKVIPSFLLRDKTEFFPQGLEDQFDRKSRRRLDGFIVPEGAESMVVESEKHEDTQIVVQPSDADGKKTLYIVTHFPGTAGEVEERRALTRLPIFVVFHGIAHERGVPPSFTGTSTSHCSLGITAYPNSFDKPGFIRQWPALPRFGLFLTVSVLPVAYVAEGDRYVVGRVEALPGFYGVARYLGFRDEPTLHIDEIVTKINELETRRAPAEAEQIMNHLVDYSRRPTHVYVFPAFHLCGNVG